MFGKYSLLVFRKGLADGSVVKNPPANAGDVDSVPWSERSPEKDNGNSLQYSCLENPMEREVWRATIYGVGQSMGLQRVGHD